MLQALCMAYRRGILNLVVDCDSSRLVDLLRNHTTDHRHNNNILTRCLGVMASFYRINLTHLYREQNRLANALAKQSLTNFNGFTCLLEAPRELRDVLHEDRIGVSFHRKVPNVGVADIKRMNGLVTDLQMFALKTLQIPLPGRHPPSSILSNGVDKQGCTSGQVANSDNSFCRPSSLEQTQPNRRYSDLFDSLQSLKLKPSPQRKVSPAMSSLQDYYGIKPAYQKSASEGFEMAVYRKAGLHDPEDGPFTMSAPLSSQPPSLHGKSKSVANGFMTQNGDLVDHASTQDAKDNGSDSWVEKLVRRRQKSDADFLSTPERLLKEDNSSGGGFSTIAGKGLALRPKSASRTVSAADGEASLINPIPIGLGDSLIAENLVGVRKSSSTPSLQDSDSSTLASLWPTLTTASITKPIFDGLPKPITGRRNKAALD
nr:LysM and putative peptidoglycan-binding domain-containing protein [Ipomoea batatas]